MQRATDARGADARISDIVKRACSVAARALGILKSSDIECRIVQRKKTEENKKLAGADLFCLMALHEER